MKQVGVEFELLKDSPSDVVADTQETLETIAEEPEAEQLTLVEKIIQNYQSRGVHSTQQPDNSDQPNPNYKGWVGLN